MKDEAVRVSNRLSRIASFTKQTEGIIFMPRTTKADQILREAKERVEVARSGVETAEGQLGIARAIFNAHQQAYYALERSLAPKPRQRAARTADPKPAPAETQKKEPICGACGNIKEHPDHDTEHYLGAHEFQPPKSGKRSNKKSFVATPEVESEKAVGIGAGGD
jgi:hypothetical protein